MTYRLVFDRIISRLDPERCHQAAMRALSLAAHIPLAAGLVRASYGRGIASGENRAPLTPALQQLPRCVPGVVGLAAGLDKDAVGVEMLAALGFGFVEVGTVTPRPQPGNDKPRLWRLLDERGIRNSMGFNNAGAPAMARRLARLRSTSAGRAAFVGVNIGKNKTTPAADAAADYRECAAKLARYADYLVINVSSPNTPGLRDLQAVEQLEPIASQTLAEARRAAGRDIPVLVKIAPDLAAEDVDAVAATVKRLGLSGVVATNTTNRHDLGAGGISGPRLRQRALEVVSRLRDRLGPRALIIGCGGVSDAADVAAMRAAGADLVQVYTRFIYAGPALPGRLNRASGGA